MITKKLILEERWIPIHVSGAGWAPRSRDEVEVLLEQYPPEWTYWGAEEDGPDGLVGMRRETRYVSQWERDD